jgi:branched-subunit amino acid aminotransferase/4-amino-4-deoxychorismate lyase
VPVFAAGDEALLRGCAAFETIRVYQGRPFLLDRHLQRLARSAAALELPAPAGAAELVQLVCSAAPPDHVLRIYRTGEALVATAAPLPPGLEADRRRGVSLQTVDVGSPSPLLAGVKSTSYALPLTARRAAVEAGADDALLVAGDQVLDCSTANLWWSTGGALRTPPAGPGVLAGVTRSLVLELAEVVEGAAGLAEVTSAGEVFTTSSIREVMPVVAIDGTLVGDGRPGPVAARLQAALRLRSSV